MSQADNIPFANLFNTIAEQSQQNKYGSVKPNQLLNIELDVERRLQADVLKDRVRIKQFFQDFDRLRKGTVGEAAFRTSLGTLNFRFHEDEIQQLIRKYRTSETSGLINYYDFCTNIDSVFEDGTNPSQVINNSKSSANFTEQEKNVMISALQEMRRQVVANRILLKPSFQDFDKSKCCHVTAQQFQRVLKKLNLVPPHEQVFELITRKYLDRGTDKEVNYFTFCKDVDRPEDMFPGYTPKHPQPEPLLPGQERQITSTFYNESTKFINVMANRFSQKPVNISNDPSDIEDRLRAVVVMRRVRIEEFFKDFDKLRKGKVTPNQFKSILSAQKFDLTQEEYQSLIEKYMTDDQFFNYADFCHNINHAFTTKGIDKDPTVKVKKVTADDTYAARRKYLEMGEEDRGILQSVLNDYKRAIAHRRINLKPQFQDFDITKNGHVTKMQFMRVLAQLGIQAPDSYMNLVLKFYMDKGNADEVNYVDFCNDVDSPEDMFGVGRDYNQSFAYYPKTQARPVEFDIVKHTPDDVNDVLARIRVQCKQQRIRVGEFFRDFDKLRSGFITDAQFRIGLNMAKIVLSLNEFEQLCEHFKAPKEGKHVKWRDFVDAVDEVFTKKGLEKAVDLILDDVRTKTIYGRTNPNKSEKNITQDVVDRFKQLLQRQRLDAKSFFQDFDRHKHFKVSPKQFRQVLANFGFLMSDEDLVAITKIYGNDENDIQYLNFINDANPFKGGRIIDPLATKSSYNAPQGKYDGLDDLRDLLFKIKATIKKERIRLGEFFLDHDVLRKGTIPAQKFRGVLHSQKIQLTNQEYELLEKHFCVSSDPNKVDYVQFNEDIEKIFTEKDLEKDPTKRLTQFNAPSILDPKDVLNEQEEKQLHDTLIRLGTQVKHKRLLIKPFFQDKDKSNSGFIANTRFRSIFDTMKLYVTDPEFHLINKRFQAKASNEINYVEFDYVLRYYSGDREDQ